jgi:hypothetical protein
MQHYLSSFSLGAAMKEGLFPLAWLLLVTTYVSLTQHSSAPVITMTYVSTYQLALSTQFYKSKVGNGVMHIHKTGWVGFSLSPPLFSWVRCIFFSFLLYQQLLQRQGRFVRWEENCWIYGLYDISTFYFSEMEKFYPFPHLHPLLGFWTKTSLFRTLLAKYVEFALLSSNFYSITDINFFFLQFSCNKIAPKQWHCLFCITHL